MLDSRFGLFACEPPVSDCGHTDNALPVYLTHFKRIYVAFSVQPGIFLKQMNSAGRFSNLAAQYAVNPSPRIQILAWDGVTQ